MLENRPELKREIANEPFAERSRTTETTSHTHPDASFFNTPADVLRTLSNVGAPCILLDKAGEIIAASTVLERNEGTRRGSNVVTAYRLNKKLELGCGPTDAIYENKAGALVPAQLVPLWNFDSGELIVLVNDGTPFRQAEVQRFERTPYAVLRLDSHGVVSFANGATSRTLNVAAETVVGTQLASQFEKKHEQDIQNAIVQCVSAAASNTPVTVKLGESAGKDKRYELVLTPDLAPNGKLLGVLAVVRSHSLEAARDEIRRIALDSSGWRTKLDRILEQVKLLVSFEHAVFGIYGNDVSVFRAIAVRPEGDELWPARWMDLPSTIKVFLDIGDTWINNIDDFVDDQHLGRDNEIVRCYRELGIKSSVTLAVKQRDGYSSALSLCSRNIAAFAKSDLDLLHSLELEPALMRLEKERNDERVAFASSMKDVISSSPSLLHAADQIIEALAVHFKWDHIALYRVNRLEERFEVVAQHSLDENYAIPKNYTQDISRGMLGTTLARDSFLTVDEIGNNHHVQYDYTGPERSLRSAMTVPIHLNGRVRWVLDVESAVSHAFKGPDIEDLDQIIKRLEEGLNQHLLGQTKQSLMDHTDKAVVIIGREGSIIEMNDWARRVLGFEAEDHPVDPTKPISITKLALQDDLTATELLTTKSSVRRKRLELRALHGKACSMLATRADLDPSLDMAIWFFTDLEEMQWARDLTFLREIVSEVADQTRASLAIACDLAKALRQKLPSDNGRNPADDRGDLIKYILAEISKADITFERLANAREVRNGRPTISESAKFIEILNQTVQTFPIRDQGRIQIKNSFSEELSLVRANTKEIRFIFRSILAYLLRCRINDAANVEIVTTKAGDLYGIRFGLSAEQDWGLSDRLHAIPHDALLAAERAAQDAAGLAFDKIAEIISSHGGHLITVPPMAKCGSPPSQNYDSISPPWRSFYLYFQST